MEDDPYIGEIRLFAGDYAPQGWLLCNGQILAIKTNQALFSILSNYYGGDGVTTFALPDLRGRAPVHVGGKAGLGEIDGTETVTLSVSMMPSHTHALVATRSAASASDPENALLAEPSVPRYQASNQEYPDYLNPESVGQTGGQAHENMPPSLVLNYIIATKGIFPPHTPEDAA